jgi:hypothetical protein
MTGLAFCVESISALLYMPFFAFLAIFLLNFLKLIARKDDECPDCILHSLRKQRIFPKMEWRAFLFARFSLSLFAPARCDTIQGILGLPYSRPTLLGGPTN